MDTVCAESLEATLDAESLSDVRARVPAALLIPATGRSLLGEAAGEWARIALVWAGMALSPTWAWPIGALLVAGRLHALGVILHDACHLPARGIGAAGPALDLACGHPLMMTVASMRYHHLRHHRDTNQPTDPYFKPRAGTSRAWWAFALLRHLLLFPFFALRAPFGAFALAFPRLRTPYARVFLQDRSGDDLTGSDEVIACAAAELRLLRFQGVVLALAVIAPAAVLWGFVLPGLAAGLLAGWRVMAEHRYVALTDRRLDSVLAVTRDHDLGWLGRLWLAPRNVGYHVAHHLHPQVAGRHLPALAAWYRAALPAYPPPFGTRL